MFNLGQYEYFEDVNFGLTKYIPVGKKILDVGCGQGVLGEIFRKNNNEYFGVEWADDVEGTLEKRLTKYYKADVTDFKRVEMLLGKNKFDIIIFADVLEHLYDPVEIVNFYKKYLKENGRIYISVPNVAVFNARIGLLFGKFNYTPVGTLDKTHIRFFTKNNLLKLIRVTDLELEKLDITPGIARFFQLYTREWFKPKKTGKFSRNAVMESFWYKFYVKFLYKAEYYICRLWPTLLAFQFIAIVKKVKIK